jgi:hypothetical protein
VISLEFYIPCPHCGGTGKIRHECTQYNLNLIKLLYDRYGELLGIYRCSICGQLWKIRWQWDAGTGSDCIWLKPGESRRGYSFTEDEAEEVMRETKQDG